MPFLSRIIKVIIIILTFVLVISELGYDINGFIAGLGLGGLAVAIFREMPVPARHLTESYAEIEDFAQLKSELSKVKTYASTIISQLGTQQVAEFQDYASSTIYDRGLSDMASHLQSELSTNVRNYYKTDLVQFFVGMEERYFMEYTTLNDPKTRIEYARLLQFLAVRENLVNTWAIV